MRKILYIDDEEDNLFTLKVALKRWFNVVTLSDPLGVIECIAENDIKVVITDQRMPQMTGLEVAKRVQQEFPTVIIIILTAYDDSEVMLRALNQGGIFRYLIKPWEIQDLRQTLDSAFEANELRKKNINLINNLLEHNRKLQNAYESITLLKDKLEEENLVLKEEFSGSMGSTEIIGESKPMQAVLKQLHQAARTNSSVLLLGETGTGKELFARSLHTLSERKDNLMVTINCAAIPETLIESELFGHEKGTFTGADRLKHGKLELAHQGTLFLDEIGELPLSMQPKLLRALQENEFERLGGNTIIQTDFRLISATNRNLEQELEKGTFRSDLFYRLSILPITIPPLRDHPEDIPLLVKHSVNSFNKKTGRQITSIPKRTLDQLMEYHWPGNIRELINVVERAHVLSPSTKLDLGSWFNASQPKGAKDTSILTLQEIEKQHIIQTLKHTKWRIRGRNAAAELLNINPSTLESRMRKLGIQRPT